MLKLNELPTSDKRSSTVFLKNNYIVKRKVKETKDERQKMEFVHQPS